MNNLKIKEFIRQTKEFFAVPNEFFTHYHYYILHNYEDNSQIVVKDNFGIITDNQIWFVNNKNGIVTITVFLEPSYLSYNFSFDLHEFLTNMEDTELEPTYENIASTIMSIFFFLTKNSGYTKLRKDDLINTKTKVMYMDPEELNSITLFSYSKKIRFKNILNLPTIKITQEAIEKIDKKFQKEKITINEGFVFLPFNNFTILIDEDIYIYCNKNEDDFEIILFKGSKKCIDILKYSETSFICNVYDNLAKHFDLDVQRDPESFASNILNLIATIITFFNNYTVNIEKIEVTETKTKIKTSHKPNITYKPPSEIVVPRKKTIIISEKDVTKSKRKRREPHYYLASWKRAGHYRFTYDKDGNVQSKRWIEEKTCYRRIKNDGLTKNVSNYKIDSKKIE